MDFRRIYHSKTAAETAQLGATLAEYFLAESLTAAVPFVVCLHGELGSGKTVFAGGFLARLGVLGRVLSPTYTVIRPYPLPSLHKTAYHIDLYRLSNEDVDEAGLQEILFDPAAIVVVEWPERVDPITCSVSVRFVMKDGQRVITFSV